MLNDSPIHLNISVLPTPVGPQTSIFDFKLGSVNVEFLAIAVAICLIASSWHITVFETLSLI